MEIPKDDYILLSFVNTKLRDEYSSLDDFCENYDLSPEDICGRMGKIGYNYNDDKNAFLKV
jgi:hypothetical protein